MSSRDQRLTAGSFLLGADGFGVREIGNTELDHGLDSGLSLLAAYYSAEGQQIAAKHYYRPVVEPYAKQYAAQFPAVKLFTIDEIAGHCRLSPAAAEKLCSAAVSLRLLVRRRYGRIAIGPLGAPLVGNVGVQALIRHHRMVYHDLRDPIALLRGGAEIGTGLSQYWSYADTDGAHHAHENAPHPHDIRTRSSTHSQHSFRTGGGRHLPLHGLRE